MPCSLFVYIVTMLGFFTAMEVGVVTYAPTLKTALPFVGNILLRRLIFLGAIGPRLGRLHG